jgi:hypothetical protein
LVVDHITHWGVFEDEPSFNPLKIPWFRRGMRLLVAPDADIPVSLRTEVP